MHTVLAQGQGSCVEAQPPWLVKGTHKLIPFDSSLSEEGSQGTRHVVGHKRIRGEALSKFDFLWLPLQRLFIFLPSSTAQTPEDDTLCSHQWGGLLSLGQNPKQKSCCYQTQVSLALWGYTSTQMRSVLLGLREQVKPRAKSGRRTS